MHTRRLPTWSWFVPADPPAGEGGADLPRTNSGFLWRALTGLAADRIIVMDHGAIVEDGTHAELLARGGRYAPLYARWSATG